MVQWEKEDKKAGKGKKIRSENKVYSLFANHLAFQNWMFPFKIVYYKTLLLLLLWFIDFYELFKNRFR